MTATARLYLDTARLGQMRRSSQLAVRDFATLSGEEALTLYGKNFLIDGFAALPRRLSNRYQGLHSWQGIAALKDDVLRLAAACSNRRCQFASRSITLVRAGANLLARDCRRVFVPDLNWTPYVMELQGILPGCSCEVVIGRFRERIFSEAWTASDLTRAISEEFQLAGCDGVLLPAVTHDGICLPVEQILAGLRITGCQFAMVDACQHLGHVPTSGGVTGAELVIAGVHKWMGAGLPLGLAIASAPVADDLLVLCRDDPLFAFTAAGANAASVMETVNLWPLLSCGAAVRETLEAPLLPTDRFTQRLNNVGKLIAASPFGAWRPMRTDTTLQSGILLLRSKKRTPHGNSANCRQYMERKGIDLSVLSETVLRLSMPWATFSQSHLSQLANAFRGENVT